ncbi:MAG: 7-carboxy-7-deazaguanine synthase QueE [Gammaproteobacteria bacterium]
MAEDVATRTARGGDTPAAQRTLRITEIFVSLQGESASVGWPTVFVRTTGCPLRCSWCDTAYAFNGGRAMSLAAILAEVASHRVHHVTVTGGEPLAQPATPALLGLLCDAGYRVSLETSGALDIAGLDPRVIKVLDLKPPGSGEVSRNRWSNLAHLGAGDEIKFVIADRTDYDWSVARLASLPAGVDVLFSPVHGQLEPRALADWIVADRLPVRFQLQLHKLLWGDAPGR